MAYAGHDGSVTATGLQSDVTDWSIDANADVHDVSVLGTQARAFIAGPTSWSGSMNMLYNAANTIAVGGTFNGTWTMASGQTKAGLAYLTQIGYSTPFEGAVVAPVTFQGTGTLT